MKKTIKNTLFVTMASITALSLVACDDENSSSTENSKPVETTEQALGSSLSADETIYKDETVYVVADAFGKNETKISSNWIKNNGSETVAFESNLTKVENVKGDETYTQDGNMLTWNANGNDIFYKGYSDNELPFDMTVSYQLDGTEVTKTEDLAGKSGKLDITFTYAAKKVQINNTDVYYPFVFASGVILDSNVASNISVSQGKVLNDGSRNLVLGVGACGFVENLTNLLTPQTVTVSADVKNFSFAGTYSVAMNEVMQSKANEYTPEEAQAYVTQAQTVIDNFKGVLSNVDTYKAEITGMLQQAQALDTGLKQLKGGIQQLQAGVKKVMDAIAVEPVGEDGQPVVVNGVTQHSLRNTILGALQNDQVIINYLTANQATLYTADSESYTAAMTAAKTNQAIHQSLSSALADNGSLYGGLAQIYAGFDQLYGFNYTDSEGNAKRQQGLDDIIAIIESEKFQTALQQVATYSEKGAEIAKQIAQYYTSIVTTYQIDDAHIAAKVAYMASLAGSYKSFDGSIGNYDGSVKFIISTKGF